MKVGEKYSPFMGARASPSKMGFDIAVDFDLPSTFVPTYFAKRKHFRVVCFGRKTSGGVTTRRVHICRQRCHPTEEQRKSGSSSPVSFVHLRSAIPILWSGCHQATMTSPFCLSLRRHKEGRRLVGRSNRKDRVAATCLMYPCLVLGVDKCKDRFLFSSLLGQDVPLCAT